MLANGARSQLRVTSLSGDGDIRIAPAMDQTDFHDLHPSYFREHRSGQAQTCV